MMGTLFFLVLSRHPRESGEPVFQRRLRLNREAAAYWIARMREDGTVVGSFGRNGRNAGQFHWIHAMAVDAKGNAYTAEVDTGKRIQKFKLTSDALR